MLYQRRPRMGGTAVLKDFVPTFDATVVSKLRSTGAVVLGKFNLSEGAAAGYNPSFDVPINPWRADRWPGMSSSVGVATAAHLFSPPSGPIRADRSYPSSANGVVGRSQPMAGSAATGCWPWRLHSTTSDRSHVAWQMPRSCSMRSRASIRRTRNLKRAAIERIWPDRPGRQESTNSP